MLQGLLIQEGVKIGRRHVATLMKRMGIEALYRRPKTSKPAPGHKVYPYLLRKLPITRPNQVWAMDITCIPMARGFIYLAAVLDWFTRHVLAWRVSITLEAGVCIEAVEEALARRGKPEIFNTDQGSQFTSTGVIKVLAPRGIRISMDGKGAWRGNVLAERLWRTGTLELRASCSFRRYELFSLQSAPAAPCTPLGSGLAGLRCHPPTTPPFYRENVLLRETRGRVHTVVPVRRSRLQFSDGPIAPGRGTLPRGIAAQLSWWPQSAFPAVGPSSARHRTPQR